MTKSNRLGFNLVELVVLIAILVILVALLLPAVSEIREARSAGRKPTTTCGNVRSPSTTITASTTSCRTPREPAESTRQDATHDVVPSACRTSKQDNVYKNNVHNAVVVAYLAPSDPYIGVPDGKINFAAQHPALRLRDARQGRSPTTPSTRPGAPTGVTLAGRLEATMSCGLTLARIPDGTSNMLMLATRYADCGSPVYSTYYSASPVGTMLTQRRPRSAERRRADRRLTAAGASSAPAPTPAGRSRRRSTRSSRSRRSSRSVCPTTPSSATRSAPAA